MRMRLHLENLQTLVEKLPVLPGEDSSNTLLIQTRNKKFFLNMLLIWLFWSLVLGLDNKLVYLLIIIRLT